MHLLSSPTHSITFVVLIDQFDLFFRTLLAVYTYLHKYLVIILLLVAISARFFSFFLSWFVLFFFFSSRYWFKCR